MQPLLVVDGLKKTYPNFKLNEVSFAVYEDCITGFIGANGAGKTTTIRSILNLISCEAGSIKFKGKDTKKAEKTFKDSIGVVFDEGFFYDELTLTQMKNLIASSYSQWDNGAYTHYLNTFSLKPDQTISSLSRGMKMKFSLALALSHHAELLIMDEPTAGLDPKERIRIRNFISEISKDKIVLLATHVVSDVEYISKEILIMKAGKVICQGTPGELLHDMEHHVFEVLVTAEEQVFYETHGFKTANIMLSSSGVCLRIVSDERPTVGEVREVRPTLEDVYLYLVE